MKTTESNKLIAGFMGIEVLYEDSIPHIPYNGMVRKMQYHTSWDWLMPVVEKISEEYYKKGIQQWCWEEGNGEDFCIFRFNLKKTYELVVEFIQWYNENK